MSGPLGVVEVQVEYADMDELVTVSRQQIRDSFMEWERRFAAGECLSVEDTAALPVEEKANRNADFLFELLKERQQNGGS